MVRLSALLLSLAFALTACGGGGSPQVTDPTSPGYQGEQRRGERTAEELYERAQEAMQRGNYRTAAERLENLQSRYPFGPYARQAQLDLIYAYFEAREMGSAINAADRFMRLNPQDEHVAYASYMRGRANLDRGNDFLTRTFDIDRRTRDPNAIREAYADFQVVVDRFPESEYADDAEERMVLLRQHLAFYEMYVADWYMRRGAYVAAANRAQNVIENFQGTPSVRDALGVLAEAYGHLELTDLQADVVRVIEMNYPDHPALRDTLFSPGLGDASSVEDDQES
ncbi:outer membrane protein assembly factor BamD [Aquisalimonas sp. 2447]|uniref:outer membrane protein assembly factor BamD n=1 Tax=Aquisalimonas sp. 2447 TaxID=2740807 RepID=UPI00143256CB|nr:outer membrane protein assembly factor BamD [Aquisalimonas sp. 2447]QIT56502.1 outer membrane protein assembly factor BamD [Aquisalimonas sp. 2447]